MKATCNVCWGSHCCDRSYGHANPLCRCGDHSFCHFDTKTVLQKREIGRFLAGEKVGQVWEDGVWLQDVGGRNEC